MVGLTVKLQTHLKMNTFNFNDCRKAVNQATFRPTAERKAAAAKLLQEALDFIDNLEEVKDVKPKAKKRRAKAKKRSAAERTADHMDRQALRTNEVGPIKPVSKARKGDVAKAKASAKAVSEASGAAAKAAKRAEAKAKAEALAAAKHPEGAKLFQELGCGARALEIPKAVVQPKVDNSRIEALEAKIEALTQCLAVAMESMTPPVQEFVGYDDVPFTL